MAYFGQLPRIYLDAMRETTRNLGQCNQCYVVLEPVTSRRGLCDSPGDKRGRPSRTLVHLFLILSRCLSLNEDQFSSVILSHRHN
jgi:hypothetical protein